MTACNRVCVVLTLCVLVWAEEHSHHGPRAPHSEDGDHNEDYDHQAVLGSEDLDDEFEGLPQEEARRRLEDIARKHDLNSDGLITKEEMRKWIAGSFQKLDNEEAMEKFNEEDEDKDDHITWKEYLNKVYSFSSDDVEQMRVSVRDLGDKTEDGREMGSSLKMVDDDALFFKAADRDGDGSLDRKEYLAFFLPPNYEHMHKLEMERYMRETDDNKDGKISKIEFMPEQARDSESRISAEENFADLDKDKDGFLSEEEAKEWVLPSTDDMVEEEVTHLFKIGDSDHDDQLTIKEILEKTREFVGSSITDYGSFLHDEL